MPPDSTPFTIRPFNPTKDIPGVVRLRTEVEAVDHDGNDVSEKTLRAQLNLPGHVPARDRWVVEAPGNSHHLLGYALAWIQSESHAAQLIIVVHPSARRKGLGQSLLDCASDHARSLGAAQALIYASEKNPATMAFLRKQGFQSQGAYTEMRAPGGIRLPNPTWPYGYQVRTYADVKDIAILTEAFNQCYGDLWGHHIVNQEQMAEWLPDWTPEGLFLAYSHKGKAIGVSRVEMSQSRSDANGAPTGYIDAPGLQPQHRRLDLYRALLITGALWLQSQRVEIIEMESWGDRQPVLDAYRDLGFSVLRRIVLVEKDL